MISFIANGGPETSYHLIHILTDIVVGNTYNCNNMVVYTSGRAYYQPNFNYLC